ncbi:hypothetical protein K439DRAFT_1647654 [Ramaria rubella]|nr:hypothetical protein K439DRAFT_1647654 [Ramaria rubella]
MLISLSLTRTCLHSVLLGTTKKAISGVYQGVITFKLDRTLAAETAAYLTTSHLDYAVLAARIAISNLHKETEDLYNYVNHKNYNPASIIPQFTYDVVRANAGLLDSSVYNRGFDYNFFGFKTLERSCLLRINGRVAERPPSQHMLMRAAVSIHDHDIEIVIETYHLSSCSFVSMREDSIEGICDTLKTCAMISKIAGGTTGYLYIAGTNGYSNGIVLMLRAYDSTAHHVDRGGYKRPGAFAIYIEPWHADQGGKWSLFCPNEAQGLHEMYDAKFVALYEQYEREGRARKTIDAQKLWYAILESQVETGSPFMLSKNADAKTNIKSSNLCKEITEYSSPDEVLVAFNLNCVIDATYYPVPEARRSNLRHRPIGVGVQGLANTFMALRIPFEFIFETIYHAAAEASVDMTERDGPYETFQDSPASGGKLQYVVRWDQLKRIKHVGMKNALLCAPMSSASINQILDFNECFELYTSNIYTRRIVCPWLLKELVDEMMTKNQIVAHNGSIQNIPTILDDEISQKKVLDLAADRGAYICQKLLILSSPSEGMKTLRNYCLHDPKATAAQAIQFTAEYVTPSLKGTNGYTNGNTLPLPSPTRTHSNPPSPPPAPATPTLDTRATTVAEDPEFAVALQRQQDRELEQAELICSLANKDACVMCSVRGYLQVHVALHAQHPQDPMQFFG